MQIHSFIDNATYSSGADFTKLNPFNREKLHTVASCDLLGLVSAIAAANRAVIEWKGSAFAERLTLVEKMRSHLESNQLEYARLEALDQGLPLSFVLPHGIKNSLKYLDEKIVELKEFQASPDMAFSPVGVIAIIASWNLSLRLVLERLVPALLAGNSCVIKISSASPVSAHILKEMLQAASVPAGLVNVIVSNDPDVKKALASHPGVKAISFVGRTETAAEIIPLLNAASLQHFKKLQVAAGSKNPAVALVEPEEKLFSAVMESFLVGQGQLAWNSARLFVLEKTEPQWEEKIRDYLAHLRPSAGIEDESLWTPCLKADSFAKFDEIKKTALDDKAKLLISDFSLNESQKQIFLPPVFTKDMSRCSTLQQDQIHSPFYILSSVKYPFDVAKYSNVSYFGFAAHLWGERDRLAKVADALDVGLVSFDEASFAHTGPVVSVKKSGAGLQNYRIFGDFYSNVKKLT